jgi:hypothetical protein
MKQQESPYSRPPPVTIWDLCQLTLIVALFSAVIRGLIHKQNGAVVTFTLILFADLLVFAAMLVWFAWSARRAQARAGDCVAALPYTSAYRNMRRTVYYVTLVASFPYQSLLLAFAANFRAWGPVIIGIALLTHALLAIATLNYWRLARRMGANFSEAGVLLHGSQFLPWRAFKSYRYSDVRNKIVLYERSVMRFRYHDFDLPPEQAEAVLNLVAPRLEKSL